MKRMKSGFTLAEVLITLGIIGVVAAIVMPSVMSNYTYKTVGVKLAKFASQLEGASRPYVVQNTNLSADAGNLANFIQESFIIKNLSDFEDITVNCDLTGDERPAECEESDTGNKTVPVSMVSEEAITYTRNGNAGTTIDENRATPIVIKDGTRFQASVIGDDYEVDDDVIKVEQVGNPVLAIAFDPAVNGLPGVVNKVYHFVVTELGYVFPDTATDDCMEQIYEADYLTNTTTFKADANNTCNPGNAGGEG